MDYRDSYIIDANRQINGCVATVSDKINVSRGTIDDVEVDAAEFKVPSDGYWQICVCDTDSGVELLQEPEDTIAVFAYLFVSGGQVVDCKRVLYGVLDESTGKINPQE
jgi:hypothetical protein